MAVSLNRQRIEFSELEGCDENTSKILRNVSEEINLYVVYIKSRAHTTYDLHKLIDRNELNCLVNDVISTYLLELAYYSHKTLSDSVKKEVEKQIRKFVEEELFKELCAAAGSNDHEILARLHPQLSKNPWQRWANYWSNYVEKRYRRRLQYEKVKYAISGICVVIAEEVFKTLW